MLDLTYPILCSHVDRCCYRSQVCIGIWGVRRNGYLQNKCLTSSSLRCIGTLRNKCKSVRIAGVLLCNGCEHGVGERSGCREHVLDICWSSVGVRDHSASLPLGWWWSAGCYHHALRPSPSLRDLPSLWPGKIRHHVRVISAGERLLSSSQMLGREYSSKASVQCWCYLSAITIPLTYPIVSALLHVVL